MMIIINILNVFFQVKNSYRKGVEKKGFRICQQRKNDKDTAKNFIE